ncbi:unnamed protein product, partial [Rotaria sp. Silwood2]
DSNFILIIPDLDEQRTYTTLTSCSFDDFDNAVDCFRISSDKNDDDEVNCDEEEE